VVENNPKPPSRPLRLHDPRVATLIQEALRGIEYGRLTVVVQDGIVVQVERTECERVARKPSRP
jgi:hypothetical protein